MNQVAIDAAYRLINKLLLFNIVLAALMCYIGPPFELSLVGLGLFRGGVVSGLGPLGSFFGEESGGVEVPFCIAL